VDTHAGTHTFESDELARYHYMHISVHGVVVVLVLLGIETAEVDEPGANALDKPAPRIQNRQVPDAVHMFEKVCVSKWGLGLGFRV
jgi:hypothetical protein